MDGNGLSTRTAVDIGGTFTDLVWYDESSQSVLFEKVLSTPRALVDGIQECLGKAEVDVDRLLHFIHGSTVAINAVIQKTGARTGLITTEGFADVYEIGRANRPDTYNLFFEKPEPLVPADLRVGVRERMSAQGEVLLPLSEASARAAIRTLKRAKVEAVAVCLLHAYANPEHELALGELIARYFPGAFVTLSHDILREYREYERTSTTVLNAYVGPQVSRYLQELEAPLRQDRFGGTLFMMQSNGGVMTAERARKAPVSMMESGPAGGIIASAHIGKLLGHDNVIGFDMGGTTAKTCLVERGLPKMADEYHIGGYGKGYPLRLPVVDITEVGAGGGSIAWIDEGHALKVGPRSAGSEPGPVSYGRGGTEPTVTDANLAIGRLNAKRFFGGELDLDLAGARSAITERVARPFDMDLTQAAYGIVKIADAHMSLAVRAITLQRGYDPRDFVMVAFGGAGPLHAVSIARELGITRVIIPPQPGHFSALGMLLTDLRHDFVQTRVADLDAVTLDELEGWYAPLEAEGLSALADEGRRGGDVTLLRSMDLRYIGQEYTVTIDVPTPLRGDGVLKEIRRRFDAAYELRYAHAQEEESAQIVNLRVAALGRVHKPDVSLLHDKSMRAPPAEPSRQVYFEVAGGHVDCPVHLRAGLSPGVRLEGPAIIEEYASTTVVHPGDVVSATPHGSLVIEVGGT